MQLAAALEAVAGDREAQILTCPTVTTLDDEKAVVQVGGRQELVTGVRAERRKGETVLAPVISSVENGFTLTLRGHASPDRRFVKVNADYTDRRLERVEVVPLAPPPGRSVAPVPYLQTPHVETTRIASGALDIPVDSHVLLRGPTYVERGEAVTVVPLLADLPYVGCLFKVSRPTEKTRRVYLVVSAKVVDDIEPAPMPRANP